MNTRNNRYCLKKLLVIRFLLSLLFLWCMLQISGCSASEEVDSSSELLNFMCERNYSEFPKENSDIFQQVGNYWEVENGENVFNSSSIMTVNSGDSFLCFPEHERLEFEGVSLRNVNKQEYRKLASLSWRTLPLTKDKNSLCINVSYDKFTKGMRFDSVKIESPTRYLMKEVYWYSQGYWKKECSEVNE